MSPRARTAAGWARRITCAVVLLVPTLAACGAGSSSVCDKSVTVSGYIVDLSQGLDNRAESEYAQFRLDSMDVFDLLSALTGERDGVDDQTRAAALVVRDALGTLIASLDDVTWDLSRAALDAAIIDDWRALITPAMLANANIVESWIISTCGLPSRVTSSGDGPDRLPDPSIPSPTATDPPRGPVDERSEQEALGTVVANLFSLTISQNQAICLGRELSDVVAADGGDEDTAASREQYQRAFDACQINFRVPAG